jgi:hypothetical protein
MATPGATTSDVIKIAVSLAWAGADTAPAMPSATAAQPPARTSSRDRRKTFIVFPPWIPGQTGLPLRQDRAATGPADTPRRLPRTPATTTQRSGQ